MQFNSKQADIVNTIELSIIFVHSDFVLVVTYTQRKLHLKFSSRSGCSYSIDELKQGPYY